MTTQTVTGRTYEFGLTDRLRIARELAGLGQREFAVATGISRQSIVNYENGITTPKRPQLIAWAMATGFSLGWLETGSDDSGGGESGNQDTHQYEGLYDANRANPAQFRHLLPTVSTPLILAA